MQGEIFDIKEVQESSEDGWVFKKQRGKWTRKQMRVIEILADPLNSIMTNAQIADVCNLSERYIYKLQNDSYFLNEVEKRRKSDKTIIRLRARVWKALLYNIEKSPSKIRTALEALGDLKPMQIQNVLQVYERLEANEVDSRLEKIYQARQREYETIDR